MLASSVPKKYLYTSLAGVAVVLLLAGHYSYNNLADSNIFHQPSHSQSPLSTPQSLLAQSFPTKIWQSWKDDSENPTDQTVGFPHQWRAVNPEYRYERITDANNDAYVRDRVGGPIADLFTRLKDPIMKADFLRYLLLLKEGGVYADIDVYPHQPVDSWVPEKYRGKANLVIGIENDYHKRKQKTENGARPYSIQLCQYTILAKPGHPTIQTIVDRVAAGLEALLEKKPPGSTYTFEDVMGTTGPYIFTNVMMDYFTAVTGVEHNGDELSELQEPRLIGDVLVWPLKAFGWLEHDHTQEKSDPMILVEHKFISSWRNGHPGGGTAQD